MFALKDLADAKAALAFDPNLGAMRNQLVPRLCASFSPRISLFVRTDFCLVPCAASKISFSGVTTSTASSRSAPVTPRVRLSSPPPSLRHVRLPPLRHRATAARASAHSRAGRRRRCRRVWVAVHARLSRQRQRSSVPRSSAKHAAAAHGRRRCHRCRHHGNDCACCWTTASGGGVWSVASADASAVAAAPVRAVRTASRPKSFGLHDETGVFSVAFVIMSKLYLKIF